MERIELIIEAVSQTTGVSRQAMHSKSRQRELVLARQIAWHIGREETAMSFKTLAAQFGGHDHSSVIHGCNTIVDLLQTDKFVRRMYAACHARFNELNQTESYFDLNSISGLSMASHAEFATRNVRAIRAAALL